MSEPAAGPTSPVERLKRAVFGAAGIYMGATVLARAGALLLIPLYTRRLTTAEYGEYGLAQTFIALLPTVFSLGLNSAVARFVFEGEREVARRSAGGVARAMVVVTLLFAAFAQGLVLLFAPPATGLWGQWDLSCVVWAACGSALASIPAIYLRAIQRPMFAAAFQLGQFFSIFGAGMLMVAVLDRGVQGAIEATALAYGLDGLAGLVFVLFALDGRPDRAGMAKALRFSLPFVPHLIANQVQGIADRWSLASAGLGDALGKYTLASQLTSPTGLMVVAWNDAVSPTLGETHRQRGLDGLRAQQKSILRSHALVAIGASVLILLALPIAAFVVGDAFVQGFKYVPFLCAISVVEALYYPANNIVYFGSASPRVIPVITLTSAATNVGLNFLLVHLFGVPGALIARAVALGGRSAAMWWAARRVLARA